VRRAIELVVKIMAARYVKQGNACVFTGYRFETSPGSGHLLMYEHSTHVNPLMREFLD
jgi:pimeloyl-ACP methyl ester carboxylesterase